MKIRVHIFLALTFLYSCKHIKRNEGHKIKNVDSIQIIVNSVNSQVIDEKVGRILFKSILDTIKVKSLTRDFLIANKWIYKPFDNCESYLRFQENYKGISTNCEIEDEYEMIYKIYENKVYVSEYDIPHVDNENQKKIKYREDTYVYNGKSLIMIDSRIYNLAGKESIAKVKRVIEYSRK